MRKIDKKIKVIIGVILVLVAVMIVYICTIDGGDSRIRISPIQTQTPTSTAEFSDDTEHNTGSGDYVAPDISELVDDIELNSESETVSPSATLHNSDLWELVIDSKSIDVGMSVTESELDKRPGWMDTSALPGEGTTVILGHRNNSHLRVLENAATGDEILLNVGNTRHSYTISEINIHEDSNYTIPATEGNALVLVTCYPFRYSGNAPGKAVVVCTQ